MNQAKLVKLFLALFLSAYSYLLSAKSIERIDIVGLKRTKPFVVKRELLVKEGQEFSKKQIKESCQRLRNLQIFATAECVLTEGSSPQSNVLTITVDERWTTIPIFKYSSGGGTSQLIIGTYDINVFGNYLELGGQYERTGDKNSGVVWYRNKRFLGKRLELFLNLWSVARERTLIGDRDNKTIIKNGTLLNCFPFKLE
ncbi:MAG: hypothetical protein HRU09_20810, partial [Oligoflexales bacterium]|nr:hypothetical protein [Oligoflexales bacterium]